VCPRLPSWQRQRRLTRHQRDGVDSEETPSPSVRASPARSPRLPLSSWKPSSMAVGGTGSRSSMRRVDSDVRNQLFSRRRGFPSPTRYFLKFLNSVIEQTTSFVRSELSGHPDLPTILNEGTTRCERVRVVTIFGDSRCVGIEPFIPMKEGKEVAFSTELLPYRREPVSWRAPDVLRARLDHMGNDGAQDRGQEDRRRQRTDG